MSEARSRIAADLEQPQKPLQPLTILISDPWLLGSGGNYARDCIERLLRKMIEAWRVRFAHNDELGSDGSRCMVYCERLSFLSDASGDKTACLFGPDRCAEAQVEETLEWISRSHQGLSRSARTSTTQRGRSERYFAPYLTDSPFEELSRHSFSTLCDKPRGLILVTGPTGPENDYARSDARQG